MTREPPVIAKLMVLEPMWALALMMAWASEPTPLGLVLMTV